MSFNFRHLFAVGAAACFLAGCGGTYNAERAYWKMTKKYEAVISDPGAASSADFNAAAAAMRKVIAAYPHWEKAAGLQFTMGRMYAAINDGVTAEKEWIKVYTDFPRDMETGARALFAIGKLYEQRKDIPGALRHYQELSERYPVTSTGLQLPLYIVQLHMRGGNAEKSSSAAEKALRDYGNLIDMNPYGKGVATVHELIVSLYSFKGKMNDAVNLLEKFADKYPAAEAAPVALYRAAMICQNQLKEPDKAMALFHKIIADYPKSKLNESVQMEMGAISLAQGNFEQAKIYFDKILKGKPENPSLQASAHFEMAAGYEKAGKWDEALKEYRQLQTEQPRSPEALRVPLLIARYYGAKGSVDKKNEELNQAVLLYRAMASDARKPAGLEVYESLSGALIMQEKWNDAISVMETLIGRYPQSAKSADALLSIGLIYREKLHDAVKARETFQQFLEKYPRHPKAFAVNAMLRQEEKK